MVAIFSTSCGGNSAGTSDGTPLIFAAASVSNVLEDAAALYKEETGKQVDFSFGGSIALANQIASFGAPADGIFFVGERPIEVIQMAGLLPEEKFANLWTNSLVVVAHKDAATLTSLNELALDGGRVAIGDPALAPAGVYAREALEAAESGTIWLIK